MPRHTLYRLIVLAKRATRRHHGPTLNEHSWRRLFSLNEREKHRTRTFSTFLYACLERRLETVIYRALWATSLRQARQWVLHGRAYVNGIRVSLPIHLFNASSSSNEIRPIVFHLATSFPLHRPLNHNQNQYLSFHPHPGDFFSPNTSKFPMQRVLVSIFTILALLATFLALFHPVYSFFVSSCSNSSQNGTHLRTVITWLAVGL